MVSSPLLIRNYNYRQLDIQPWHESCFTAVTISSVYSTFVGLTKQKGKNIASQVKR